MLRGFLAGSVAFGALTGAIFACSSFSSTSDVAPEDAATTTPDADEPPIADASTAPLFHWTFDGTLNDLGGNVLASFVPVGSSFTDAGVRNQALHCEGKNHWAQSINGLSPFTLGNGNATFVVWFLLDTLGDGGTDASTQGYYHTFFDHNLNWGSSEGKGPGFGMGYMAGPSPMLVGAIGDGRDFFAVRAPLDVKVDTWHMAALVVEPAQLTLYADGLPRNQVVAMRKLDAGALEEDEPIQLCDIFSLYLRGSLDEMMIFDRALSAGEVATLKTSVQP